MKYWVYLWAEFCTYSSQTCRIGSTDAGCSLNWQHKTKYIAPQGTTGGLRWGGGRDLRYEPHFQTAEGYISNKHKLTGSGREVTMVAHLKKRAACWLHHIPCFLYQLLTRNSSLNCDCSKLSLSLLRSTITKQQKQSRKQSSKTQ
jgi:hypothetical protein